MQECRICDLNQLKATLKNKALLESKEKELTELFKLFFAFSPKPIITAQEFASTLAQRTQILKDSLIEAQENTHITSLYETFKEQLYKELDFTEFADSLAQTLTYSLFLARLNNTSGKEIDLYNAKAFIPKSFPLIRSMSGFLDNLEDLDSIKWLIEEILYIINHIDITSIIKELNKASEKDLLGHYTTQFTHKDPYLHFYETFLSQYDPRLREIRGVYYTPASVVSFIINAIDSTLKKDFALKNGLGSGLENDNITLLDFATGTGTFLLEAFRKALESTPKDSARYEPKKLLKQFFGFEFLIAPYTIAHLKLSQSFKEEFYAPLEDKEKLEIYLTNTLYNGYKKELNEKSNIHKGGIPELVEEAMNAQNTKENAILIITGNPPYSGASANKGLFEDNVRITYGLEPSEADLNAVELSLIKDYLNNKNSIKEFKNILERKKLKNEKNPKWLLDDYVKFINFAESKIKAQNSGIFAFISNNGFLDNPTFRGMRYHLLKTFDTIYILDLHGNARKKEAAPDGSKDENVFDIMQGVSINIFVKQPYHFESSPCHSEGEKPEESQNKRYFANAQYDKDSNCQSEPAKTGEESHKADLATLYHYDLYGKRSDKTNFLYENTLDSIAWQTLKPQAPFYLFIPQNESLRTEYDKGFSVKDIFKVSGVGITTAHDEFVIDSSKEKLLQKFEDFKNSAPNAPELHKKFNVKEKQGWDILKGWQNLKNEKDLSKFIQKIAYRPFDKRYIFYEEKLVWRCVKDIMQHFLQNDNVGLNISRQTKLSGNWQNAIITNTIVDFSLMGGGNTGAGYISPLYLKNTESSKDKKSKKTKSCHIEGEARNISQDSNRDISPNAQYDKFEWIENFTPEFREFIDSKYNEHFSPEQILGYIYAVLFHKDYREKYIDFLKIDFPKIPFVESKKKFLEFSTLGWELINTHLLQSDTLDSDIGEGKHKDYDKDTKSKDLIEKIAYDPKGQKLFVNDSLHFCDVSEAIWEYKIGGYQVLDKYLKSHKNEEIDCKHFSNIIKTLHKSLEIESQIAKIDIF